MHFMGLGGILLILLGETNSLPQGFPTSVHSRTMATRVGLTIRRTALPIYDFQCDEHDRFELRLPMSAIGEIVNCPKCGVAARRMVSAPRIVTQSHGAWMAAVDHADKSRYEPEVVTQLPTTGLRSSRPIAPLTPQLAGLPRP